MSGLLRRTDNYRETHRLPGSYEPEELVESSSDVPVSGEDEILAEIDKIAAENKIPVDENTFRISAQRRGLLLPVMVNLLGILIAVSGVYGLYLYFQEQERALVAEPSAFEAAENALIEALRAQSEEELAAKEAEIGDIRQRLSQIEAERQALEANLESEIEAREQALREQLESELAAERARLEAQGLSPEQLQAELESFESSRQEAFTQELAALEAQAEEERRALEENLARLEDEFQARLSDLEQERLSLEQELAAREAELEAQAERALSAQQAELTEAQRRLANLAELQEREAQVSAQIVGFYDSIREDLRAGAYDEALQGLLTLENYLNDPSLQEIPLIQERQATERFVISSLRDLVEERQSRTEASGSLLAAARQLQRVTDLVSQGNRAAEEGNPEIAEARYSEAIDIIPEVAQGHDYLMTRRQAALQAEIAALDRAQAQGASAALSRARRAAAQQRYQQALEQYQEALEFLPAEDPAVGSLVAEIQRLSLLLSEEQTVARQTAASEALMVEGRSALSEEQNGRAIDAFLRVLEEYPRSSYRAEAVEGLEEAIGSQRESLLIAVAEVEAREAAALEAGNEELASLREEIAALQGTLSEMENELASLKEENEELRVAVKDAEARARAAVAAAAAEAATGEPGAEPETAEIAGEAAPAEVAAEGVSPEAAEAAARLERIRNAYREYRRREAETLRENEEAGRIAAKLYLDDFLQEESVRAVLPGLDDTIRQYDRAFEVSGRRNALLEAADLVYNLSALSDSEARRRYLNRQLESASDPDMESFVQELLSLVES